MYYHKHHTLIFHFLLLFLVVGGEFAAHIIADMMDSLAMLEAVLKQKLGIDDCLLGFADTRRKSKVQGFLLKSAKNLAPEQNKNGSEVLI